MVYYGNSCKDYLSHLFSKEIKICSYICIHPYTYMFFKNANVKTFDKFTHPSPFRDELDKMQEIYPLLFDIRNI